MTQSKIKSLIESAVNSFIGIIVAIISQLLIFPLYDIHVSFFTNIKITFWFTIISIIRSYIIRRLFNGI